MINSNAQGNAVEIQKQMQLMQKKTILKEIDVMLFL